LKNFELNIENFNHHSKFFTFLKPINFARKKVHLVILALPLATSRKAGTKKE